MLISWQSLVVESFRSIERLELDLGAIPVGLHFFRGINKQEPRLESNGAGKSTVFDALTWIPFGKTTRGLRTTDVVPWGTKDRPVGGLIVKIGKDAHELRRISNAFTIDGKEATPEAATDLLMGYDLFVNTVILGQGRPLFFDLPPAAKMQLFTDVLVLERWEARSSHAGKEVSRMEGDLAAIQGELTGHDANVIQTLALIKASKLSLAQWDADREEQLQSLGADLEKLQAVYERLQARADEANLAYDGAGTEFKHFVNEDARIRNAIGEGKVKLAAHKSDIRVMEDKLADMERDAEAFGVADKCPVCGQPITGTDFEKHKNNLDRDILKLRREIKDKRGIDKFQNVVALLEKDLETNRQYLVKYERRVDAARAILDLALPQATEAKSKLTFLRGRTEEWKQQENPYREQLTKLRKQLATIKAEITKLEKEAAALEKRMAHVKFWVKGFKDVRLFIIEEVLQELELATNAMLEEIGLVGWAVQYDIEKETKAGTITRGLNVSISSPASKTPARWEAWSGGEGQRLRLVGALALSDVLLNYAGVQTDLEILDEPTRGLSPGGVRDLCEWLSARAKMLSRRTLLVDHHAVDAQYFESTFTVVKDEHGSRIVKGGKV